MVTRRLATTLLSAAALAAALGAQAEEPVQATVDRSSVRVNESFTFVLRAEGPVRGEPETAPLAEQFDILNVTSSRRIGIVNTRAMEVNEWQFQLMPRSPGDFMIPSLRVGDRQSNAVEVRVLPQETSVSAAADVFMELTAEPGVVYAQAQVLVTLKLYVGVSTGRAMLTAPETNGVEAIVEKLGEDTQYQATRGGRNFIVRERRYAVFPQSAGTLTIGPATFEATVIPDRGFSRVQRLRSDVLELTVEPAVPPPAALAGASWLPAKRVTLREQWSDDGELAVGVPRTRTIVVEGLGLLETQLPDVLLEPQQGIRQYADRPELAREITREGLLSRRTTSFAVIAQAPGELTLSGVRLPWWNVTEQRWEVAELPPRTLEVRPAADPGAPPPPPRAVPAAVAPALPAQQPGSFWRWVSAVLAAGWLATLALWWRSTTGGAPRKPRANAPDSEEKPPLRKIMRDLASACAVNDAHAARDHLLRYAAARFAPNAPRSLGALAVLLPEPAAAEVLALEAHIYGAASDRAWRGDELKAALESLERAAAPERVADEPLLPLYR